MLCNGFNFLKFHFRQETEANFVLSGIIIYSAARIYGRKVDYLEQEISGMAKNFEDVGVTDESNGKKTNETKKTRTKKFFIHDSVNIRKVTFDEKEIAESSREEIIKTLPEPTRINLLQKMKEFFSKAKSKTGKTVVPKKLLFTSDFVTPNFGATQIYDYDDQKDIVGSRKDFTCFSYYINNFTGELQNEVNYGLQIRIEDDGPIHPEIDLDHVFSPNFSRPETPNDRMQSPIDFFMSPPRSPDMTKINLTDEMSVLREDNASPVCVLSQQNVQIQQTKYDHDLSHLNIDEGIDMDDDRCSILLPDVPSSPTVKVFNPPTSVFPAFPKEILSTDFDLPSSIREEVAELKIVNIFMVPLKKLKHKCAFSLPDDEYGDLKRMKKDQSRNHEDLPLRQTRIFNPFDIMKEATDIGTSENANTNGDEPDFLGFTEEQQKESASDLNLKVESTDINNTLQHDLSRKNSNDSGFDESCTKESDTFEPCSIDMDDSKENLRDSINEQSQKHRDSIDLDEPHASLSDININLSNELETESNINISGGDSCYQSYVSGESTKTELSAFFRDIESINKLVDEQQEIENHVDEETLKQSEERVKMMQQSAMNVSNIKKLIRLLDNVLFDYSLGC